jgi:class 3 adenylate cyclase
MSARRLAAIMAVDVVGYSRLIGKDEARAVRKHRQAARPALVNVGSIHYGRRPSPT